MAGNVTRPTQYAGNRLGLLSTPVILYVIVVCTLGKTTTQLFFLVAFCHKRGGLICGNPYLLPGRLLQ